MERPPLDHTLTCKALDEFYYLKAELMLYCKTYGLSTSGSKQELIERIKHFLQTGEKQSSTHTYKQSNMVSVLSEQTRIEENFVCSQKHRAFFEEKIGKSFSFHVAFQKWLKANGGKTYQEAIEVYQQMMKEKKHTKTTIDKQFEYNTYIRDFFADQQGKSLADAIQCWNYKKTRPGHHRYEKEDLKALDEKRYHDV